MNTKLKIAGAGVALAGLLAITGCSSQAEAVKHDNGDEKAMNIAVFNGWDEGVAASELWKEILTEKGYDVKLSPADVAPIYQGLSDGDYDVVLDTWLPTTHKTYMEKYQDKVVDLGAWYDEAKLTLAVNADAPIDSIDELLANADTFNGKIIGIEPGAGLTTQVKDNTIPEYKLDEKFTLTTSSTPGMLSELKTALDKNENIVVTLWRPHWAYDAFDIKDLKDPKNTLGVAESVHSVGTKEFENRFPEAAGWIKNFTMSSDQLNSLENAMFNSGKIDDYTPVVKKWISENQDYVDSLTK